MSLAVVSSIHASPPPLSAFLDPVKFSSVKVSPTGKYIAASINEERTGSFRVLLRSNYEPQVSFKMGEDTQVGSFTWLDDETVLVRPARRGSGSDVFYTTNQLMKVNVKSGRTDDVGFASLVDEWRDNPRYILVAGSSTRYTEIDRMDIRSGRRIKIARSASPRASFVFNQDREVVFSIGESVENEIEVHQREGNEDWELVETIPYAQKGWRPFRFGLGKGQFFTYDHRGASTLGIGMYNAKTREHQLVFRHPVVDVSGYMFDYHGNIFAFRTDHHYPAYTYLLPKHPMAQAHRVLTNQFPNQHVMITSETKDSKSVIAYVTSDRNPGQYFLVNLESGKADLVGEARPALKPDQLASMNGVEITTRDGDTIYGYVSSMPDTPTPGPMIVEIHGGPHGVRDFWGYDRLVQMYATRGFHVLQVNYRGSGGYGLDYRNKGHQQWGRLMQDDVTDATRWAIAAGIADPNRICIGGGSYGAYSAMMGAAREPDLYRCAIGLAGVYDLTIREKTGDIRQRRAGIKYLRTALQGKTEEETKSISPVFIADQIKIPVMLIHGGMDRRTPPIHAHRLREALQKSGNPPIWYWDPEQGHGFFGRETNIKLYSAILDFLGEHIGPST